MHIQYVNYVLFCTCDLVHVQICSTFAAVKLLDDCTCCAMSLLCAIVGTFKVKVSIVCRPDI